MKTLNLPTWSSQEARIRQRKTDRINRKAANQYETGRKLLRQIYRWVSLRVEKYNQLRDREKFVLAPRESEVARPEFFFDSISVRPNGGTACVLKITYSFLTGVISYLAGEKKTDFNLKVTSEEDAHVVTMHRNMKSISAIRKAISSFERHSKGA